MIQCTEIVKFLFLDELNNVMLVKTFNSQFRAKSMAI